MTAQFPTTSPEETVSAAAAWLQTQSGGRFDAIGVGSFGPVDLKRGVIASTPKEGWRDYDLAGAVRRALNVPVRFDTDVNAAVLAEARWGAARGISNALYITIGTGIGGGSLCDGRLVHGLTHPEMGHIRVPHDWNLDPFHGVCPFHGDCLEGLASGPSIAARWGAHGEEIAEDHPAWLLEARYLALGVANFICMLSPEIVILGGGVMRRKKLRQMVRDEVRRLLAGYIEKGPQIVEPGLGELSGVLGAIALASEETNANR